jgi:hypothetical protein
MKEFLGPSEKLRKATLRFVVSVRQSVCPSVRMEQLGSNVTDFHEILYWSSFRKTASHIQVQLKLTNSNRYFTWKSIYISDHMSLNG